MTKIKKPEAVEAITVLTKHQRVVNLLMRDSGATLDELAILANWLPHSTLAYLTGLKKKGHVINNNKVDGVRRYRITSSMVACGGGYDK